MKQIIIRWFLLAGVGLPSTIAASYAFTGPAGGILGQAYIIAAPNVPVAPTKFEPKFSPH
jgi:hypothetical protein